MGYETLFDLTGKVVLTTGTSKGMGRAMVEAMAHGCLPLLPHRLSYPEILPDDFHDDFLYHDQQDLETRLVHLLTHRDQYTDQRMALARAMRVHAWQNAVHGFDAALTRLADLSVDTVAGLS